MKHATLQARQVGKKDFETLLPLGEVAKAKTLYKELVLNGGIHNKKKYDFIYYLDTRGNVKRRHLDGAPISTERKHDYGDAD